MRLSIPDAYYAKESPLRAAMKSPCRAYFLVSFPRSEAGHFFGGMAPSELAEPVNPCGATPCSRMDSTLPAAEALSALSSPTRPQPSLLRLKESMLGRAMKSSRSLR